LFAFFAMVNLRTDQDLVLAFQGGDRAAFSDLFERYQNKIFTLCVRRLGDRELANEVAQDVFIAVFRSLTKFRGDSKFSTWLYRIAVNHCKNRFKYNQRRRRDFHQSLDEQPTDEGPKKELPAPRARTDASTHRAEASQILQAALEQLSPEDRSLLVLRELEELSYEEISEIFGVPKGTIKSRLHRARAQLAKVLSTQLSEDDL
jgi:RNA polymerase sigma-70 factor (ECF subfamily)